MTCPDIQMCSNSRQHNPPVFSDQDLRPALYVFELRIKYCECVAPRQLPSTFVSRNFQFFFLLRFPSYFILTGRSETGEMGSFESLLRENLANTI